MMSCWSVVVLLLLACVALVLHAETAEAKREFYQRDSQSQGIYDFFSNACLRKIFWKKVIGGCATFGHSCYGGMGKRASELLAGTNEVLLQDIQQQGDENPAFVFTGPRSEQQFKPEHASLQRMSPQQYDSMSRIIRQWIQSYRRAQELQGNNII